MFNDLFEEAKKKKRDYSWVKDREYKIFVTIGSVKEEATNI